MKLERRFVPQQLLSVSASILISFGALQAQDRISLKDGKTQEGKVLGVTGPMVQVQVGAGSTSIPLSSISQIVMVPPADFASAQKAYEEKNFAKAVVEAKAVVDKYKGLPAEWAQQATAMVGDAYAALNDLAKAEAAYKEYQKLYPGVGSAQTDVGLARLALLKKDYAGARTRLDPLAAVALKEKSFSRLQGSLYGQVFYLLGQIDEAEGKLPSALENYLRTVTVFSQDRIAANGAQEKAELLRKQNPAITVP